MQIGLCDGSLFASSEPVIRQPAHRGESSGHRHAEPKRTQPVARIGAVIFLTAERAEPPVILTTNTLLVTDRTLKVLPLGASSILSAVSKASGPDDNFLKLVQCIFIPIWE